MSGIFTSRFNHLQATLSNPPALSKWRLVTAWVKWVGTQEPGRIPVQLESSDSLLRMELLQNNGMSAITVVGAGAPVNRQNNTLIVTGTWTPVACYVAGGTSGTVDYGIDINGTRETAGYTITTTPTGSINLLRIAQGGGINEFSNWNGRIAHVAVWALDNLTQVQDVMTQVRTLAPPDVVGFTPVWYASLDSDATATGGAITTNGSPTYDSADDPALGDTIGPTLSLPTGTQTSSTTATVGFTTNEANGTGRVVVTTSVTQPSIAQIKAGQNNGGTAAAFAGSQAITTTGAKTFSAAGLMAGTTYWSHGLHTDAANNDSNRVTSASFTTPAPDTTRPTMNGAITVGTRTSNSISISYLAGSDNIGVIGYEVSRDGGTTWFDNGLALSYTFLGLTQNTSYPIQARNYDAAGNRTLVPLSANISTFRAGALASQIIANTAPSGGSAAGWLYDLALASAPGDWLSYVILSGPTPGGGTLVNNPDGSASYTGPAVATITLQRYINDTAESGTTLITMYDSAFTVAVAGLAAVVRTATGSVNITELSVLTVTAAGLATVLRTATADVNADVTLPTIEIEAGGQASVVRTAIGSIVLDAVLFVPPTGRQYLSIAGPSASFARYLAEANGITITNRFPKQPRESKWFDISFAELLQAQGDTPRADSPVEFDLVPTGIIIPQRNFDPVTGLLRIYVSGGITGKSYLVTMWLNTTSGQRLEHQVTIRVKEDTK